MHERSLVQTLLEQVRRTAIDLALPPVREVVLELGEFSGVEAELVKLAFADLSPVVLGDGVTLELRQTPLTAECSSCQHSFHVERFQFVCPKCAGTVRVTAGEEFRLVSLRVESSATAREMPSCR